MKTPKPDTPKTLAEILDRIDWVREELVIIQRSLEKLKLEELSDDGKEK